MICGGPTICPTPAQCCEEGGCLAGPSDEFRAMVCERYPALARRYGYADASDTVVSGWGRRAQ